MIIVMKRKQIVAFVVMFVLFLILLSAFLHNKIHVLNDLETHYKIYLTFDDGPSMNTEKVLDVLQSYNVKATFFVIGQSDENIVSLYRRIVSEGHSLGLHSFTHNASKIYASAANYIQDFERLRDLVHEQTGDDPKICRMVGGSHSMLCSKNIRMQIIDYFNHNGYTCFDWDIDPLDSGSSALSADTISQNIMKALPKKPDQDMVILLHDDPIRKTLPDALDKIIPYFLERGFRFDALRSDTVLNNSRAMVKND